MGNGIICKCEKQQIEETLNLEQPENLTIQQQKVIKLLFTDDGKKIMDQREIRSMKGSVHSKHQKSFDSQGTINVNQSSTYLNTLKNKSKKLGMKKAIDNVSDSDSQSDDEVEQQGFKLFSDQWRESDLPCQTIPSKFSIQPQQQQLQMPAIKITPAPQFQDLKSSYLSEMKQVAKALKK